jgi:pyruvate/2-oxoglutarate/acetoin dehydrogenase E1 component
MRELTYILALREALQEEMRRDERVLVLGESVRGGNYDHTVGLVDEFGLDRVLDTPIAETAISGAGIGAALAGYRPVVELMFADFMYVAADEVFLKAAQWRFMHGGQTRMPVVFLMAAGGGLMLANEHSRIPEALVLHHPGLKLAVPSNPYDAKGLLKRAIRDDDPVVVFWHKAIMGMKGEVPEEDYTVPFGVADVKRDGEDVTIVATSNMVNLALKAAAELAEEGITTEVIDPRTLEPFDLAAVLESVGKTNRLVIADEDTERCGFAAELAMQVMEHGFDLLDAPIKRVCAANCPIAGGFMEQHVLPSQAQIETAVREALAGS